MLTSLGNSRVKDVVKLRNRRHRDREGRFVIEGCREVARAIDAGFDVATVYYCEALHAGRGADALLKRFAAAGVSCQATSRPVFEKMSYRQHPDGLLAVAPTPPLELADLAVPANALLLVVAAIEKPGNLGAMLRAADASGADAVLVADPATDVFNPNVVRASVGTLFGLPLAVASAPAVRAWLNARGTCVVAASPSAETPYTAANLCGEVAIVVGSEHDGLDSEWLDAGYENARIPMAGHADSMNAAMTAAVLLFEARRQRSTVAMRDP